MSTIHQAEHCAGKTAQIHTDEAGVYMVITDELNNTDLHFSFTDTDGAMTFANKLAEAALLAEKQRMALSGN